MLLFWRLCYLICIIFVFSIDGTTLASFIIVAKVGPDSSNQTINASVNNSTEVHSAESLITESPTVYLINNVKVIDKKIENNSTSDASKMRKIIEKNNTSETTKIHKKIGKNNTSEIPNMHEKIAPKTHPHKPVTQPTSTLNSSSEAMSSMPLSMTDTLTLPHEFLRATSKKIHDIANDRLVIVAPHTALDKGIIGSLLIGLVALAIIAVLFVMLICFMHRWRENMIQSAQHPSVVYSMLRQNENDPEDQLGEILVSIGLASESDMRPDTPSSASSHSPTDATSPRSLSPQGGNEVVPKSASVQHDDLLRLDQIPAYHPLLVTDQPLEPQVVPQVWNFDQLSRVPLGPVDTGAAYRQESDEELLQ